MRSASHRTQIADTRSPNAPREGRGARVRRIRFRVVIPEKIATGYATKVAPSNNDAFERPGPSGRATRKDHPGEEDRAVDEDAGAARRRPLHARHEDKAEHDGRVGREKEDVGQVEACPVVRLIDQGKETAQGSDPVEDLAERYPAESFLPKALETTCVLADRAMAPAANKKRRTVMLMPISRWACVRAGPVRSRGTRHPRPAESRVDTMKRSVGDRADRARRAQEFWVSLGSLSSTHAGKIVREKEGAITPSKTGTPNNSCPEQPIGRGEPPSRAAPAWGLRVGRQRAARTHVPSTGPCPRSGAPPKPVRAPAPVSPSWGRAAPCRKPTFIGIAQRGRC